MPSIGKSKVAVRFATLAFMLLVTPVMSGASAPKEPPLGALPEGHTSVYEVRNVGAEVCRRHAFAPATMASSIMPHGYRLATLKERGSVPWIAELLRRRPELGGHASGAFCFIEAGGYTVDGAPVYQGRRSKTVFLWADMVPTTSVSADPRFRGATRRVQLFWLYDSEGVDRDLARRATPNALFGRVTMEKSGDSWRLGIQTDDGNLSARVSPTSERKWLDYPMPGYETVPLTDAARDHFYVVTFAGHHEQQASGEWRASGTAGWARSFADAVSTDGGSFIQDGWAARLGLYRLHRP